MDLTTEYVFADPAKDYIKDMAVLNKDLVHVGAYSKKTLAEIQAEDPAIELIPYADFELAIERRRTTDPEEITEDRYWYLLEVLPPCGWHRGDGTESFYMSEFITGRVTTHVVRIGERYFTFDAPVMRLHSERITKVSEWLEANG